MRKLIFVLSLLSAAASAQSFGPFQITGSQCASVVTTQRATATYQVLGSWTGTIQPKVSVLGQSPVNTQTTPVASSTAQSTVTANGAYFSRLSGYSSFSLCGNTVTNTATVYINVSSAGR